MKKLDPIAWFHSLSWRATFALLLMVFLLLSSGLYSFWQLRTLTAATDKHANTHLPTLELLNATQLSITRLANLSSSVATSESAVQVRVQLSQVRDEIQHIRRYLKGLGDNKEIEALNKVVDLLEPNIEQIGVYKSNLSRLETQYEEQYAKLIDRLLERTLAPHFSERDQAVSLIRKLTALNNADRQFEIAQSVRALQDEISKLEQQGSALMPFMQGYVLSSGGIFENRRDYDQYQSDVIRLDTQNRILLGNVIDYGQRVYGAMEQSVRQQADSLQSNATAVSQSFYWVVICQIFLGLLLFIFFRYQLFARISALGRLVDKDSSIPNDQLSYFDERNEIGRLVHQLDQYIKANQSQQRQLANVGTQLEGLIRQSQMRVAVLAGDAVLFCSDSLAEVFPDSVLQKQSDFPERISGILKGVPESETPELVLEAFYDAYNQRWFDVTLARVMWTDKIATLVSFIDVTDRVRAASEFKRTLTAVENEAYVDSLTGLYNRKMLDKRITEIERHSLGKNGYAVLMFDVDFFKPYNDHYGHLKGDEALIKVAEVLKRNCPVNGDAIRYGGEEFVMLIAQHNPRMLMELAQLVLEEVYALEQEHPTSAYRFVTLSCGIAASNYDFENFADCFERADQALYRAKNNGRNCVVVA